MIQTKRLTSKEVDQLADDLGSFVANAPQVTRSSYRLTHEPTRSLGVLRAVGFPQPDITTSSTFGLAHEDWSDLNFPHRIELVYAWSDATAQQERFLIVVAEFILRTHQLPKPGAIYEDAMKAAGQADVAQRFPHGLLIHPYLFGDSFDEIDLGARKVWFLQLVPINEREKTFIDNFGFKKFEELLEFDGVRFHDLKRMSHVSA